MNSYRATLKRKIPTNNTTSSAISTITLLFWKWTVQCLTKDISEAEIIVAFEWREYKFQLRIANKRKQVLIDLTAVSDAVYSTHTGNINRDIEPNISSVKI